MILRSAVAVLGKMGAGALDLNRTEMVLDVGAVYLGEANFTDYLLLGNVKKIPS